MRSKQWWPAHPNQQWVPYEWRWSLGSRQVSDMVEMWQSLPRNRQGLEWTWGGKACGGRGAWEGRPTCQSCPVHPIPAPSWQCMPITCSAHARRTPSTPAAAHTRPPAPSQPTKDGGAAINAQMLLLNNPHFSQVRLRPTTGYGEKSNTTRETSGTLCVTTWNEDPSPCNLHSKALICRWRQTEGAAWSLRCVSCDEGPETRNPLVTPSDPWRWLLLLFWALSLFMQPNSHLRI